MVEVAFRASDINDYRKFVRLRSVPTYHWRGHTAVVPDEYAGLLDESAPVKGRAKYKPLSGLFDYQEAIARIAIRKGKFAVFADCGLGKTLILLEFARHASEATGKKILIVSPLMVVNQTLNEAHAFYEEKLPIVKVVAADLQCWLNSEGPSQIGITNYEAIRDGIEPGKLGGLILDESSMLKSHYGKWGTRLIQLGRGLEWKLCCTGTPAPNDRIEYANHSVFLWITSERQTNSLRGTLSIEGRLPTAGSSSLTHCARSIATCPIGAFFSATRRSTGGRITATVFHRFTYTSSRFH